MISWRGVPNDVQSNLGPSTIQNVSNLVFNAFWWEKNDLALNVVIRTCWHCNPGSAYTLQLRYSQLSSRTVPVQNPIWFCFMNCSVTFGVLKTSQRPCTFSSGIICSPLAVPCLTVDRIEFSSTDLRNIIDVWVFFMFI